MADDFSGDWLDRLQPGQTRKRKGKGEEMDDILGAAGDEAFRIRDEEESRGAKTEQFLGDEFGMASKATLTDEDIARMFTSQSDAAARTSLDQEAGLRANLGASGIQGGGYAAGLLTGFENQRMATVTDARRSLAITKATTDANDRLNRFKNAAVLAAQMSRDPSTAGSDFLNDATGIVLAKKGMDKQMKMAGQAQKNALTGALIGGGLGLAGKALL